MQPTSGNKTTRPRTIVPNWKPLADRLGSNWVQSEFLFIGRAGRINVYLDRLTQSFLNLDDEGHCYEIQKGRYRRTNFEEHWNRNRKRLSPKCQAERFRMPNRCPAG